MKSWISILQKRSNVQNFDTERMKKMACKCAIRTDEYHGWECSITEGECMFLFPNSKLCAEIYGEGPDAEEYEEMKVKSSDQEKET